MANHSKHARSSTFAMPSKSSLVKIAATVAAVGLLATGGIVSRNLYTSAEQNTANQVTAFSVTDSAEASRGNARELLNGDTSYVTETGSHLMIIICGHVRCLRIRKSFRR